MQEKLTEKDISDLKYRCRVGYLLPGLLFVLGTAVLLPFHAELGLGGEHGELTLISTILIVSVVFVLAAFISFMMNRKYLKDIKNGFKIAHKKTIQRKSKKRDFEAGSGNVGKSVHGYTITRDMTEFARYDLIIDNTIYLIDEELYDKCNDGDEVLFFYAPESKYFLGIEKNI